MKGVGIVAGTKNDCELIESFILHHLRIGFSKIHIMDFNSTDGTKEILERYIDHPKLEIASLLREVDGLYRLPRSR